MKFKNNPNIKYFIVIIQSTNIYNQCIEELFVYILSYNLLYYSNSDFKMRITKTIKLKNGQHQQYIIFTRY